MGMKKRGPGCPCECRETPCSEKCSFPCIGEECPPICLLDIQLPVPDTVGLDELIYDGEPCENVTAPCYTCYLLFDRQLSFEAVPSPINPTCNEWSYSFTIGGGLGFWPEPNVDTWVFNPDGTQTLLRPSPCWNYNAYNCPYIPDSWDITEINHPCFSIHSDIAIIWYPFPDTPDYAGPARFTPVVQISGNEWDGECGKITLLIAYTVIRLGTQTTVIPIDPGPDPCYDIEGTFYEYVFELSYCNCTDLVNNSFTLINTTATNSCRGVTVDDPCNMENAVIKLKYGECQQCSCFNCEEDTTQVLLEVNGPDFTGTIPLNLDDFTLSVLPDTETSCAYKAEIEITEGCNVTIVLFINCLPCDKYYAVLYIYGGNTRPYAEGFTEAFDCGYSSMPFAMIFPETSETCDLNGYSFSLS